MEHDQCVDPLQMVEAPNEEAGSRDRSKSNKFKKMIRDGQLPDLVVKEWERTLAMSTGRLVAQRRLINLALDHDSAGQLVVSLQKPYFKQLQDRPCIEEKIL